MANDKKTDKYSGIKTLEEAIGLLKEQDKLIDEQNELMIGLNESNAKLEKKVVLLEKNAAAIGVLPSFEFQKKNYQFTARVFHMEIEGEFQKNIQADKIVSDLHSSDEETKKSAEAIVQLILKNKIGVIAEVK